MYWCGRRPFLSLFCKGQDKNERIYSRLHVAMTGNFLWDCLSRIACQQQMLPARILPNICPCICYHLEAFVNEDTWRAIAARKDRSQRSACMLKNRAKHRFPLLSPQGAWHPFKPHDVEGSWKTLYKLRWNVWNGQWQVNFLWPELVSSPDDAIKYDKFVSDLAFSMPP